MKLCSTKLPCTFDNSQMALLKDRGREADFTYSVQNSRAGRQIRAFLHRIRGNEPGRHPSHPGHSGCRPGCKKNLVACSREFCQRFAKCCQKIAAEAGAADFTLQEAKVDGQAVDAHAAALAGRALYNTLQKSVYIGSKIPQHTKYLVLTCPY